MDKHALRKIEREALVQKLFNANINDCTDAFLGIVRDKQPGTIFYDYEPKNKIGQYIFSELLAKYTEGKGFILSDDIEEIGVLSQAQGACTLGSLIDKYDVVSVLSKQDALKLICIYEQTIRDILSRIHGSNGRYLFNATPYNINVFDEDYSYLDTMTWVVSAFLGALSINKTTYSFANSKTGRIAISFNNEEIKAMLDAIAYCVHYFTDCFIDISKSKTNQLSKGWNFTKNCCEPSLYFTYAVSECYLDIYGSFQQVIDRHNINLKIEKVINDRSDLLPDDVWLYISVDDRLTYEAINENSESYQEQLKLFDAINGSDDVFYVLEQQIKASAKNIWSLVKKGIDSNFYNYNLSSFIDTRSIENSSSSDALFNNIFVINNIITGGLDEDLQDLLAGTDIDEEMARIQNEYDDLLESLQAALQRTIRYNKLLRSKRKDYIVNDYFISCSENYEGESNRKAQELRKKRIKTFTLSPLLVKTNNLISEYLTKYPQAEMIKYVDELIMKKRTAIEDAFENGKLNCQYIWIWENGEYLVTSNYYYILSLSRFYDYVENYENRFTKIDRKNAKYRDELIAKHDMESRQNGELFRLSSERNNLKKQNDRLLLRVQELEARESEVEAVLRSFIGQEMKTNFLKWATHILQDLNYSILADLEKEDFEEAHGDELAFLNELRNTLAVTYFDQMRDKLNYNGVTGEIAIVSLAKRLRGKWDENATEEITDIIYSTEYQQSIKKK